MDLKSLTANVATATVLLSALALNHCTEKNYVNQPITDSVHIHGTVLAWRCSVGDILNNSLEPSSLRFSMRTGEPAIVTFIRDNGFTSTVETDDSSDFDLYLSAGSHRIVIETGYTFPPDTIENLQLRPGDTTLLCDIVYTVSDPLHITCLFSYGSIEDTMSISAEWDVIRGLNNRSLTSGDKHVPVFDLNHIASPGDVREVRSELFPLVYHIYDLPIFREYPGYGNVWNVSEAYGALQRIINGDTTGFFPSNFGVEKSGSYICMF